MIPKWLYSVIYTLFIFSLPSISVVGKTPWVVQADQPTADIQPTTWGILFEDINFAADGDLYAEQVKNYSFTYDGMDGAKDGGIIRPFIYPEHMKVKL